MPSEDELIKWLTRQDKTFEINFQFAIKAWKSAEFPLQSKYEIIFQWFSNVLLDTFKKSESQLDWDRIDEFLNLSCSPGLIRVESKNIFIENILKLVKKNEVMDNRKHIEILQKAAEHQSFQECYNLNKTVYMKLTGKIFHLYDIYLQNKENISTSDEQEFFDKCVSNFKDFAKRTSDIISCKEEFKKLCLKNLVEVIITLKSKNLLYFSDLLEIEKYILLPENPNNILEDFNKSLSLHVVLMNIECAIAYYRGFSTFMEDLVNILIHTLPMSNIFETPNITMIALSHILDLFGKYDVQITSKLEENLTVAQYLGYLVQNFINDYHEIYLYEILTLLCSIIKLNPLILEQNIVDITTKCLVAQKAEKDRSKYEEFLMLVMEMFKKLSRSEKLVLNLLKSIKEYLKTNKISKKLKRKIKLNDCEDKKKLLKSDLNDSIVMPIIQNENIDYLYLKVIFNEFVDQRIKHSVKNNNSWTNIANSWPPQTVGLQFSKFISTIMSKPSLVIWKTILFSLSECIQSLQTSELDKNLLFLIDFNTALFSQYFAGSRLAEHSDKYFSEIEYNRALTRKVLKEFAQILLNLEHNNRTMNAFLEISYYFGNFELIYWYYCPDSINLQDFSENIHDYLSQNEWILIKQRIVNFGKNECKIIMNRLNLQKLKFNLLFSKRKEDHNLNVNNFLLSSTFTNIDQIKAILTDSSNLWIINNLKQEEKLQIFELFFRDESCVDFEFLKQFVEFEDLFEIILLNLYKEISKNLNSKKSILSSLDFEDILNNSNKKQSALNIVDAIYTKFGKYSIKKSSPNDLNKIITILVELPLGFTKIETKSLLFTLNLALYRDLLAIKYDDLINICVNVFSSLLHFGEAIEIFQLFDIDKLIEILPPSTSPDFYKFIFSSLQNISNDTEKCLLRIVELLKSSDMNADLLKLSIILVEILSQQHSLRKGKRFQEEILSILSKYLQQFFTDVIRDNEKDKEFVEKTIPIFPAYINSFLGKTKQPEEIDEKFRRIWKIYIGHSINCHNSYSIRLMNLALIHRNLLHFDPDEIQFVLRKYWELLKNDLKSGTTNTATIGEVLKLLIPYKSNEDFYQIFFDISKDLDKDNLKYACKLLSQIAKCQLNASKGIIFNEQFKSIIFEIITKLEKDVNKQFLDQTTILDILECQKSISHNKQIPISIDLIDDILSFIMDININKIEANDKSIEYFKNLYRSIVDVCLSLIKVHHMVIVDRIPQFLYIFRDLLQALCWYKSDRQKDSNLETSEIDDLAELAQKLESLMHQIAVHNTDIKRVAPYLLTFTIGLMVGNKRSTTLYPKVKTHIESICYDLIAVCDHRVGSFILRCSNDATKQVYETLCKEYKRYHKFKGKV